MPSKGKPRKEIMNGRSVTQWVATLCAAFIAAAAPADKKPNIIVIVSDDFGYGDSGAYGGGPGRGMPTPNLDRMAEEGITFFSFYGQPSCTPGRAAMITGRLPHPSALPPLPFQSQAR